MTETGRFTVKRVTDSKRLAAKLRSVKTEVIRRRHQPIPEQERWLASVLRGHTSYYGVPGNRKALLAFRLFVTEHGATNGSRGRGPILLSVKRAFLRASRGSSPVGSFAAAVARRRFPREGSLSTTVGVEATGSACVLESLRAGRIVALEGQRGLGTEIPDDW